MITFASTGGDFMSVELDLRAQVGIYERRRRFTSAGDVLIVESFRRAYCF
ncbi:hypothetical protein [Sporosarcina koreensis]|uniref:Uncharacterized protein n=1 Tax=Sporosarcina koreensis TaxID=334735 RepID=A0ABW0U1J7_9BACL